MNFMAKQEFKPYYPMSNDSTSSYRILALPHRIFFFPYWLYFSKMICLLSHLTPACIGLSASFSSHLFLLYPDSSSSPLSHYVPSWKSYLWSVCLGLQDAGQAGTQVRLSLMMQNEKDVIPERWPCVKLIKPEWKVTSCMTADKARFCEGLRDAGTEMEMSFRHCLWII